MKKSTNDIKKDEKRSYKFKMQEVYNFNTDKVESADYHLSQDEETVYRLRTKLMTGEKNYGCPVCKNRVILKVSSKSNPFFSHTPLKEGQACYLVDSNNNEIRRIQEYNYRKESQEHIFLKETIAYHLKNTKGVDVNSVKIEKVVKGQATPGTWKKPDVQFATKKGAMFAVEVQLSNTWLSDIVKRDVFYKEEGISILWVFNEFKSKGRIKTTKKDIFYNNPAVNVFVFDEEAMRLSESTGDLHLNCYFKFPEKSGYSTYTLEWKNKLFNIRDIQIHNKSGKPYFVDTDKYIKDADAWLRKRSELIKKEQQQRQMNFAKQRRNARLAEEKRKIQREPILGKVETCEMDVMHKETKECYSVVYQKKNTKGKWYFTKNGVWLFAKDCVEVEELKDEQLKGDWLSVFDDAIENENY